MKVGDYVRTDKGTIDKLTKENIMTYEVALMGFGEKPIKSSSDIIGLIEENDYINGLRVEKNKYGDLYTSYTYMGGLVGTQEETYTTFLKDYENDYIQSIVTKEQFKSIEYEVK